MSLNTAILCVTALMLVACTDPQSEESRFAVTFLTESDAGLPLAGVEVQVERKQVGVSSAEGIVQAFVTAEEGSKVAIDYECPPGHRDSDKTTWLLLRQFEAVGGTAGVLELKLRCPPERRTAAFVVRTENGAGLPVLLNGEPVALTNKKGIAHFSVRDAPQTEYQVRIDTSAKPRLKPQNPVHQFTLVDQDSLFTVGQEFHRPKRKRPRIQRIQQIR